MTDPGGSLERALSAMLRWSTRPEIRRSLQPEDGPALSATDLWLLGRIADHGPQRISALAAWHGVDRSTMTAQVERLARHGLVRREDDPADRRAVLVAATGRGQATHDRHKQVARQAVDALVADWPEQDRADLGRLLDRLVERIEASISASDGR